MFVYSMKASSLKFIGIVCIALVALVALIAFVPAYAGHDQATAVPQNGAVGHPEDGQENAAVSYRYDKVKTTDDAAQFLSQFGWVVDAGSAEVADVTIPAEFDKIFAGYNEMQKAQGLDLTKYKKKAVKRYTFTVTNCENEDGKPYDGAVMANVLVYRGRVIGGDICSADANGFIRGFEKRPADR